MNKKQKKNTQTGITLIALVITIIILLILAMVSIKIVMNGGIINKSKQSAEQTEQAQLEEEVKIKVAEKKTAEVEGNNDHDLGYYLEQIENANVQKIEDIDAWYVTRRTAEVTVYDDGSFIAGKVDIWNGETIESPEIDGFNWNIYNCAQLKFFADFVNNGNKLTEEQKTLIEGKGYKESDISITEDTQINLMSNLDLGARQENGKLKSGKEWTPIGTTSDLTFIGTFEGNNNVIKGIYENRTEGYSGLFGVASKIIKNVTVKDSYIKTNGSAPGSIAGYLKQGGEISNCKNENTEIISTKSGYAGGIVGLSKGNIDNCTNTGKIQGPTRYRWNCWSLCRKKYIKLY